MTGWSMEHIAGPQALRGKRRERIAAEVAERFARDRMSVHELASQLGRRPSVVRRLLDEAGVQAAGTPCVGISEQETAQTLARRYEGGASISALVRQTGLDKRVIRGMLSRQGVALPERHSPSAEQSEEIAARYRAGESIRTLAASTGCSYGTVRSALLATGVELRPRGSGAHAMR
ncbi:MAG TPA: helix-turn-helix domain-containing protein [Pseudonocardiaceae bacterium]|nr:helix-turn-helix domain-containing protein [Pseudonocardiaceae bacterium]